VTELDQDLKTADDPEKTIAKAANNEAAHPSRGSKWGINRKGVKEHSITFMFLTRRS
jgi:hypothetical protein